MKTVPLIGLVIMITAYACQKSTPEFQGLRGLSGAPGGPSVKHDTVSSKPADTTKSDTSTVPTPPFPQQTSNNNTATGSSAPGCPVNPIYGDTIVFPQPTAGDDIITPVNNPGQGKYFSWPVGMVLDQNTGAIDLTQSQTGMKYILGFVPAGTKDTCLSTLIIGGASYFDSVHVLADGQTIAAPYYEANPSFAACANGGCSFDVTGSAAAQKVVVNTTTGAIDLQKTLNGSGLLGGAFGPLPVDGSTVTTTIYYRINYGSNNALQSIQVQLQYYTSKSLISLLLLNNLLIKLNNELSGNVISTSTNPRPPLVIMTRYD